MFSFFFPTVESLTRPLSKIVEKLEAHVAKNRAKAEALGDAIQDLHDERDECFAETRAALKASEKIKQLIS